MAKETAVLVIRYADRDGKRSLRYEVPAGQSIRSALEGLDLPRRDALVAIVNGLTSDTAYILQPGDEVQLLAQIVGG